MASEPEEEVYLTLEVIGYGLSCTDLVCRLPDGRQVMVDVPMRSVDAVREAIIKARTEAR